MSVHATPSKLRDGSWGIRTDRPVEPGEVVTVTTRAGKTWNATVSRVLWTGTDRKGHRVCLCATESRRQGHSSQHRHSRRQGRCRECGGPIQNCSYHRAMGGLCGQCAFDEYDC